MAINNDSRRLAGRVAIVTGASSGIGRASAELFAAHGCAVALVDIDAENGNAVAESIRDLGVNVSFHQADVSHYDEVARAVRDAHAHHGKLNILFSNAASYAIGSALELTEFDWDRTLATCLKATWMLAREAVPRMEADGRGSVVVTGSTHALIGYPRHAAYQAAKGGLVALVRSMAVDFAPRIRVNGILPGAVETGLWKNETDDARQASADMSLLKRLGTPQDIASAALFLVSDDASFITGSHITVDGGVTAAIHVPREGNSRSQTSGTGNDLGPSGPSRQRHLTTR